MEPTMAPETTQSNQIQDFASQYAPEFIENTPPVNAGTPTPPPVRPEFSIMPRRSELVQPTATAQPVVDPAAVAPTVVNDFDKPFLNDQGQFDIQRFMDYQAKVQPKAVSLPMPQIKQPVMGQPVQAPVNPVDKFIAEHNQYIESTKAAYLKSLSYANQFMQQPGMQPQQAMYLAQQQIERELDAHFRERELKARLQLDVDRQSDVQEQYEMQRKTPIVNSNLAQVANEFGGAESLNMLLQHPELGAKDIMIAFHRQHEGKQWESQEAYVKDIEKYWVNLAQNPDNIRYIADNAQARLARMHMPKLYDRARQDLQASQAQRMQAVTAQTRTVTSPASSQGNNYAPEFTG